MLYLLVVAIMLANAHNHHRSQQVMRHNRTNHQRFGLRRFKDALVLHDEPHDPIDSRTGHLIKGQALGDFDIRLVPHAPRRVRLRTKGHADELDDPVTVRREVPTGDWRHHGRRQHGHGKVGNLQVGDPLAQGAEARGRKQAHTDDRL